jgi:hypothetical protein
LIDRYDSGSTIGPTIDSLGGEPDLSAPRKRARIESAVLELLT